MAVKSQSAPGWIVDFFGAWSHQTTLTAPNGQAWVHLAQSGNNVMYVRKDIRRLLLAVEPYLDTHR